MVIYYTMQALGGLYLEPVLGLSRKLLPDLRDNDIPHARASRRHFRFG